MKNLYTIYNQRLAGFLMMNGVPIISIEKNSRTGKNDFVFPNTTQLNNLKSKWLNHNEENTEEQIHE